MSRSLWDRIGEIDDVLGDVPAGIAFGIARATGNDRAAAQAVLSFSPETQSRFQMIGPASSRALDWLDVPVSYGVKRPLSTANSVLLGHTDDNRSGGFGVEGSAFDMGAWRDAWNASAETSAGQQAATTLGQTRLRPTANLMELTPEERQRYFHEDTRARIFSGTVDAALYLPDPLVAAGRTPAAIRGARNTVRDADRAAIFGADSVHQLSGRAARQRALLDEFVEKTEGRTVSELAQMEMFRNSEDAGALAYWFGRANEVADGTARREMKRDILAVGFGDQAAVGRIRQQSAALADEIETMSSQIDELETARMFTTPGGLDFSEALGVVNEPSRLRDLERARDRVEQAVEMSRRLAGDGRTTAGVAGSLRQVDLGGSVSEKIRLGRVAKVIHDGAGTNPIHVITGQRIPGVFRASDHRATDIMRDVLGKARYLPPERRRALLDRFTVASPKERALIASQAENEIWRAAAAKFAPNLTRGQLDTMIRTTRGRRAAYLQQLKSRAYGTVDTDNYVPLVDEDGIVMALDRQMVDEGIEDVPMLSSQLTEQISMVDPKILEQVLRRHGGSRAGLTGFLRNKGEDAWEVTEHGLSYLNRMWKFSALFRVAYPIRVQVDTQMRLLATLGAMEYTAHTLKGSRNFLGSLRHLNGGQRRELTQRLGMATMDDAARARLAKVEQRLQANPTSRALQDEKARLIEEAGGRAMRTRSGVIDATPYRSREEYDRIRGILDPEDSIATLMTDSMTTNLRNLRATGAWDRVAGDRPEWMSAYLRVVNRQFRNDPVAMKMVAGESDDSIIRWMRTTPEGRDHWRLLRDGYPNPEALTGRIRQNLDELLPEGSALRQNAAVRQLRPDDVDGYYRLPADRPAVRGELLKDENPAQTIGRVLDDVSRRWYNLASTMPEQVMGRHPLYVSRFRGHFEQRIRAAESVDGKLTLQQVEQLRRQASQAAQRDVSDTLFDLFRQGNLAHASRFVSPFFAAWEDTMLKWSKIIGGDLGLIPRGYQIWGAPNNAGLVVDEEGRTIRKNGDIVDDDGNVVGHKAPFGHGQYIMLPASNFLREKAGIGGLRVSKTSFNILFQGDPFWLPGPGPMLAVPANTIATGAVPELVPFSREINQWGPANSDNPYMRWVLPFGPDPDGAVSQTMPSWMERLYTIWEGMDSRQFAGTYQQLYAEEQNRIRLGLRAEVSEEELAREVMNKTRNWYLMRFLSAEASPVSVTPQSPLQFYLEEYRRYRREHGGQADSKFREDYPDYYDMAINLSKSNTGLNATVESWEGLSRYRARAGKYPEYAWAYAGAANVGGEFSPAVYAAQFTQAIGPGTSKRFREPVDPAEQARQVQVNKGWDDYQAGMTELNLALEQRGLSSFQNKGAEDLDMLRRSFIEELKGENEAWGQEFGSGGNNKVEAFLRWAEGEASRDSKLADRRDFRVLGDYVAGRQEIMAVLASRQYSSLDHESNADVKQVWDAFVQQLIAEDIGFEQMYHRVLERDDLSTMKPVGVGTDG